MSLVSVVMPARDAAPHVGAAVASVLAQTHRDLEVVVVDDGSGDETAAIAASFGGRVRVMSQANAGVAAARNRGIEAARGELIAFCDADDILFPSHLAALLEVRAATGADVVTANAYWLFETGIDPGKRRHRDGIPPPAKQRRGILEQNFVSTMALFPRALHGRLGGFDPSLRHAEDWDFWMRAVFSGAVVAHQPRPLALYRWGEGLSADRVAMDAGVREVLRRARDRLDLRPAERAYVERRLASPSPAELLREADEALRAGDRAGARRGYRAAASLVPSERAVVWKARVTALPLGGTALRLQQRRADRRRGTDRGRTR